MPTNTSILLAADTTSKSGVLQSLQGDLSSGAATIAGVPADIERLPLLQFFEQAFPAADLVVGGILLIVIILLHATGVRTVTSHVAKRTQQALAYPSMWRADLLMGGTVFMLLLLHVLEIYVWSSALVYGGLIADWRTAGFYAGNTYTTLGYDSVVLPKGWGMLSPVIAMSGLFTFGWSGSVLVDLVGRCQKIKDAVIHAKQGGTGAGDQAQMPQAS